VSRRVREKGGRRRRRRDRRRRPGAPAVAASFMGVRRHCSSLSRARARAISGSRVRAAADGDAACADSPGVVLNSRSGSSTRGQPPGPTERCQRKRCSRVPVEPASTIMACDHPASSSAGHAWPCSTACARARVRACARRREAEGGERRCLFRRTCGSKPRQCTAPGGARAAQARRRSRIARRPQLRLGIAAHAGGRQRHSSRTLLLLAGTAASATASSAAAKPSSSRPVRRGAGAAAAAAILGGGARDAAG